MNSLTDLRLPTRAVRIFWIIYTRSIYLGMDQLDLKNNSNDIIRSEVLDKILSTSKSENIELFLKWDAEHSVSCIEIISEEEIWSWSYWTVMKIECIIWDHDMKKRRWFFALKVFNDKNEFSLRDHTYLIHKKLKEIWISTWDTCRRWYKRNSILMSLWNLWNKRIISINNNTDVDELCNVALHLLDMKALSKGVLDDIYRATKHELRLWIDAYMIVYDPVDSSLQHIVWDLDKVSKHEQRMCPIEELFQENVQNYFDRIQWLRLNYRDTYRELSSSLAESFEEELIRRWFSVTCKNFSYFIIPPPWTSSSPEHE